VYLVVLVVVLQVLMLISVFWLRAMVVKVNVKVPKASPNSIASQHPAPQPVAEPEKTISPSSHHEEVVVSNLPSLQINSPHPALLSVPKVSDQLSQISTLNDEAQAFMKQHALESALEVLTKAEDIDPRHPDTLQNLATLYGPGMLNDAPMAKIYWQRLYDLGAGVGTIYGAAQDHIALLNTPQASILNDRSTHPRLVYVDSVEKSPVETVDGKAQFHLRATLARKDAQASFDQKKLQPYVVFYQQMPNGTLVPDLAQRKGAFDDTFLFWNKKLKEPFNVDYVMPIPSTNPNGPPIGNYYGFIIGIYYDKMLQDVRSEPSDLITRIPLPDEIE